ncbi:MAG: 30S ribosome-binding factor RbfA [Bacteroidia bacterium]|nr:30S ribosome-binding factor RbfA [Bacteroidia bacterium]
MSIRTSRVAALIKQQISETLSKDIETAGYGLLTVTEVTVTPDLRLARVHVSHFHSGKTDEQVLDFLNENAREIRMAVGKSVRIKFTPELRFYIDQSLDRVERIEELLRKIHEDEKNR